MLTINEAYPFPTVLGGSACSWHSPFFGTIDRAYRYSPSSETVGQMLWKDCLYLHKLCQQSSMLQSALVLPCCSGTAAFHLYLQGKAREERFLLASEYHRHSTATRKLFCQRDFQTEATSFFIFLYVFTTLNFSVL